jgi:hypothetical protein
MLSKLLPRAAPNILGNISKYVHKITHKKTVYSLLKYTVTIPT